MQIQRINILELQAMLTAVFFFLRKFLLILYHEEKRAACFRFQFTFKLKIDFMPQIHQFPPIPFKCK